jgi:DNA-binding NarL/FixJ family response regulator
MSKINIMIIDEDAFFRVGVRQVLSKEPDFTIMDCAPKQGLLEVIEDNLPNVVLLGSNLASYTELELGATITRYYPNTKVIMLSPNPDDEELFQVIKTAAVACLNRNVPPHELVKTIRRITHGEYPINDYVVERPKVAERVLRQFEDTSPFSKTIADTVAPLTKREMQILNYIAEGNTNRQIAHNLGISEQTIKSHVSAILRKLNANDRAHAVALAMRKSMISTERYDMALTSS